MASNAPRSVLDAIRHEMTQRNVSQRGLARLLGWDPIFTHRRISGAVELTVPELQSVAAALGVPLSTLIPADDQPAQVTS